MSDTTMQDQATAAPGELDLGIGIFAPPGAPRPDLNGLRITPPGENQPVYLILEGTRRHIPNPATYDNLFIDWSGIYVAIDIDQLPEGPALTDGALLANAAPRPGEEFPGPVHLITNGKKWWVTSLATRYHFDMKKSRLVPPVFMDFLPSGPDLK